MIVVSGVPVIKSRQNIHYKQWQRYVDHPEDQSCPWIPTEGWKLVRDLCSQRPIELLLYSNPEDPRLEILFAHSRRRFCVSKQLLNNLSSVECPQGVVAFFTKPTWDWSNLTSRVLYLDRLQDPGNLGTLLRTAQATGMFSLVTSPKTVAFFNSKVIRASSGSLFSVPFLENISVLTLKQKGYELWAANPVKGFSLFETHLRPPIAILIGNEGTGLGRTVMSYAERNVHIPMRSSVESLNAAVAGSLIMYELFRQGKDNG